MNWYNELNNLEDYPLDISFLVELFNNTTTYDKEYMYCIILEYMRLHPNVAIDYNMLGDKIIKFNLTKLPTDLLRLLSNYVNYINSL